MLKPDKAMYYTNRGNAYSDKEDYDHAIADYDLAIALKKDYADAYFGRGYVYKQLQQTDRAIADFKKYLELSEDTEWRQKAEQHLRDLGE